MTTAQYTYERLLPGSRTTRGLVPVTQKAPPAATTANTANATDPVEAPSPASSFKQAIGVRHALGAQNFRRYVCVCVCLRVFTF